jgi:hypothetical protein
MPLWGNRDFASGNNKPNWANTANVFGVNTAEAGVVQSGVAQGWVEWTRGRGYIVGIDILNVGSNIVSSGFLAITGGNGSVVANASYTINSVSNTVATVTLVNPGADFNTQPAVANVANTGVGYPAQFRARMGGRFGRNTYETLVVVKGMSLTDDSDTAF